MVINSISIKNRGIMPGRTGEGQNNPKKEIFAGYIRNHGGRVERAELKAHYKDEYKWTPS